MKSFLKLLDKDANTKKYDQLGFMKTYDLIKTKEQKATFRGADLSNLVLSCSFYEFDLLIYQM